MNLNIEEAFRTDLSESRQRLHSIDAFFDVNTPAAARPASGAALSADSGAANDRPVRYPISVPFDHADLAAAILVATDVGSHATGATRARREWTGAAGPGHVQPHNLVAQGVEGLCHLGNIRIPGDVERQREQCGVNGKRRRDRASRARS